MSCKTILGKYAEKLEREIKKMNKEIELLYKKLDAQDKIIDEQALEISQLKEELENDIDRYEDTISYQLGFDKGKEYLQQRIDKAIEYIKNGVDFKSLHFIAGQDEALWKIILSDNVRKDLLEILGDEE